MQTQITIIPLSQLVASPFNVRKRKSDNVESLAANIATQGLIHNLVAHPIASRKKQFGVADGERRLTALQLLRSKGTIPASFPVPCKVISEEDAIGISLSANVEREDMHPADVYSAMLALLNAGQSVERIAAAFNVTPLVVTRRLKLANVAPMFMEMFRKDEIDLDCMMALALTDDHEQQIKIWNDLPKQRRNAYSIRELLTEGEIDAKRDPIAKYVGLKAYQKAGGFVRFDLFSDDLDGFLADGALLQRLAQEKLERKAAQIAKDGWAWVEAQIKFTHADQLKYGRVRDVTREPTKSERKRMEALQAEIDALGAREEELSEEENETFYAKQDELDEIHESLTVPDPDAKSYAGAVVTIDHDGNAVVITGLVRPEDKKRLEKERKDAAGKPTAAGTSADTDEDSETSASTFSERLTRNLTAHFTAALQAAVARSPQVALAATVYALLPDVLNMESRWSARELVRLKTDYFSLSTHAPTIDTFAPSVAHAELLAQWRDRVPKQGLMQWLLERSTDELLQLLALCTAHSIDAVSGRALNEDAKTLARAVSLDMADCWSATNETFLGHVPKSVIAEAVTEAHSAETAAPIAKAKKNEAITMAEALLGPKRWIPSLLRI